MTTATSEDVSDATGLVQMVPDCLAISKIIDKYRDIKSFFIHEHPDPVYGGGFRAAFEYVGYFVGSGAAFARVPSREREAAEALFARCRELLGDTADT